MYPDTYRVTALLALSLFMAACPRSHDLEILVPEDLDFESCLPWKVKGSLEVEMAHNLYDGLFNPSVTQGYEGGMAEKIDAGMRSGEGESDQITVHLRLGRTWVAGAEEDSLDGKSVDAFQVAAAWKEIAKNPGFPGGSRYWSVIEDITADAADTLKVRFTTSIDLSRRAPEALSFRVFPVPRRRHSIPLGSGPFFVKFPAPKEQFRYLYPSPNFPSTTGVDRPRLLVRTVSSSQTRLDRVLSKSAHIALGIPPYYLHETRGAEYRETDPYNVWALVFNHKRLSLGQRRLLASGIDAEELLGALVPGWSSAERKKRLSPTIFPRTFDVFDCIENRRLEGRLEPNLLETAKHLREDPKEFAKLDESVHLPDSLRVAYLQAGSFRLGMKRMAEHLKERLKSKWPEVRVALDGQEKGEWQETVRTFNSDSLFDIAIVRFEYQRRCDVSVHFQKSTAPSVREGLFSWVAETPYGEILSWNSNNLKKFREAGRCDAAVVPALEVIRAARDVAPAKFLFSVPNLVVFQPTVDLEVHDEYVMAGLKDWHETETR